MFTLCFLLLAVYYRQEVFLHKRVIPSSPHIDHKVDMKQLFKYFNLSGLFIYGFFLTLPSILVKW